MGEEKKYSVIGTVTIGTDEYRELIEQCAKFEADRNDYRDKYWSEQNITNKLTNELESAKNRNDMYTQFIKDSCLEDKLALWKVQQEQKQEKVEF